MKRKLTTFFTLLCLLAMLLCGCGKSADTAIIGGADSETTITLAGSGDASSDSDGDLGSDESQDSDLELESDEEIVAAIQESDVPDETNLTVEKDGTYTSKEEVCLYLETYGELPSNFITKSEAKKLGWEGGSLEKYAPGKCIGGDTFGNYEGLLPENEEYHECDIDTLGADSRGAKRLVYSDTSIYYTEDHYETFELLFTKSN
jgi:ribonuclease T1